MVTINEDELKKLVIQRLREVDISWKDAETIADVLVFADLRGGHSHGVLRVEHYVNRIKSGGMNCNPELKLELLKPGIGLVDAQGGPGHVTTRFSTAEAIKLARTEGLSMIGIRNNSHCGALAYYVQMALDARMAAMVMVNTDACVVPYGGRQAFFGTNPFAFGFPGSRESILLDMATSEVAFGKIFYAREKEQPIPAGWAVDVRGNPTTDPNAAKSLFPFGGAKGYGINIMVEALTGLMIGGVFGPHLTKMYGDLDKTRDLSNFILVIDPAVFGGDAYLETSQRMIDELHSQAPAEGFDRVMIPGEIENTTMQRSRREGISIPQGVYEYLAG